MFCIYVHHVCPQHPNKQRFELCLIMAGHAVMHKSATCPRRTFSGDTPSVLLKHSSAIAVYAPDGILPPHHFTGSQHRQLVSWVMNLVAVDVAFLIMWTVVDRPRKVDVVEVIGDIGERK